MKTFWIATALLLIASTAPAKEQPCDAQIRTANAMMEELQEHIRLMSARAAQHYGQLSVELAAARVEIARLASTADHSQDELR